MRYTDENKEKIVNALLNVDTKYPSMNFVVLEEMAAHTDALVRIAKSLEAINDTLNGIDDRIYDVGDRIDDIKGDSRTGNAYIKGEVTTHRGY